MSADQCQPTDTTPCSQLQMTSQAYEVDILEPVTDHFLDKELLPQTTLVQSPTPPLQYVNYRLILDTCRMSWTITENCCVLSSVNWEAPMILKTKNIQSLIVRWNTPATISETVKSSHSRSGNVQSTENIILKIRVLQSGPENNIEYFMAA